jgi:dGTPase
VEHLYPDVIDKLRFNEALKLMLNHWVDDLIAHTQASVRASGARNLEQVCAFPRRLVTLSPAAEQQRAETKHFLYQNLYFSDSLASEKIDAERVIGGLFEFWMERPEDLPPSYRSKASEESLARVVCDYVAGMTDNFICQQYEKHCQQ